MSNCGLPDGVVHAHVERCYEGGRRDALAEVAGTCAEHGDALIWESGGVDMPTVRGRWYCPTCQAAFNAAMDAQ